MLILVCIGMASWKTYLTAFILAFASYTVAAPVAGPEADPEAEASMLPDIEEPQILIPGVSL